MTISTHSEGGLTEADFELAGRTRRPISERLRIDDRLSIPLAEVELRASRSSGPGGQHANVTASRVEAVFDVEASAALEEAQRQRLLERLGPVVTAVAQDARGQSRNRELALRAAGREDRRGRWRCRAGGVRRGRRAPRRSGGSSRSGRRGSASGPGAGPADEGD